jgi:hypothetical protein
MQGGEAMGHGGKPILKKKGAAAPKKTLGIDHVMQFLTAEMPTVATKISTLFPDLVPSEYRPESIKLLERIRFQEKAKLDGTPVDEDHASGDGDAQPAFLPESYREDIGREPDRKRPLSGSGGDAGGEPRAKKHSKASSAAGGAVAGGGLSALFGRKRTACTEETPAISASAFPGTGQGMMAAAIATAAGRDDLDPVLD